MVMPLAKLPPVPLYPNAQNVAMAMGEDINSQVTIATFDTTDSSKGVRRFYQQALAAQSWLPVEVSKGELLHYVYTSTELGGNSLSVTFMPITDQRIRVTIRIDAWNIQ
jgi:hypothetical protein